MFRDVKQPLVEPHPQTWGAPTFEGSGGLVVASGAERVVSEKTEGQDILRFPINVVGGNLLKLI